MVLVEEEANGGNGPARRPGMSRSSYKHLVGKTVAELDAGLDVQKIECDDLALVQGTVHSNRLMGL